MSALSWSVELPALVAGAVLLGAVVALSAVWRFCHRTSEFRAMAESSSDGLALQDEKSRILWANSAYCRFVGADLGDVLGNDSATLLKTDPKSGGGGGYVDRQLARWESRTGDTFIGEIAKVPLARPRAIFRGRARAILSLRDVTDQMRREEALRMTRFQLVELDQTDQQTGLLSRKFIHDWLDSQLAMEGAAPLALFNLAVDDHRDLNEALGHVSGDHVLHHMTETLRQAFGTDAVIARLSDNEFLIAIPGVTRVRTCIERIRVVEDLLRTPVPLPAGSVECRVSAGIARHPGYAETTDDLITQTRIARDTARHSPKRGFAVYGESAHRQNSENLRLKQDLPAALDEGAISFRAQPVFDMSARKVTSVELLARWQHPTLGDIPPDRFVSLAQSLGLTSRIDRQAAAAAIRLKADLTRRGLGDTCIGFNVSAAALLSDEFTDWLIWEADRAETPPGSLIVEVLETTVFSANADNDRAARQVVRLRRAGFLPYLDDFGIGFAGLSHLARLPAAGIKIDRSLVTDIHRDNASQIIVGSIARLAHQLGITVIAEGAETAEQIAVLKELDCTRIQGYAIARPMTLDTLPDWIELAPTTVAHVAPAGELAETGTA